MPDTDNKAVEVPQPDFERALRIMTHDIKPAEESNASARGDLSAAWKAIEDECHCNKAAAKAFNKLRGMSEETRDDYLRTLYGLMRLSGIGVRRDLVDQMEGGEAPGMPVAVEDGKGMGADNLVTLADRQRKEDSEAFDNDQAQTQPAA